VTRKRVLAGIVAVAAWAALAGLADGAGEKIAPASAPAESAASLNPPPAEAGEKLGVPGKPDSGSFGLGTKEYEGGRLLWESLAAVLVILALGGVGLFLVRRLVPRISAAKGRRISLVESLHVAPQKSVHLLQVGDRSLLVGASRDGLRLLADVTGAVPAGSAGQADKPRTKFVIPESPEAADQAAKP
jgi:flagellar biogenesis protein FliO